MSKRVEPHNNYDDYNDYTMNYVNLEYNYNGDVDSNSCNHNGECSDACNNNNNHNNSSNSNNSGISDSIERSTFNLRKAVELRQARLQQRQQQQQQQLQQQQQSTRSHNAANVVNAVASPSHSPTRRYAHSTRRKRLQRQTPTELDDMDFAYAADLEEEAEEDYVEDVNDEDDDDDDDDNEHAGMQPHAEECSIVMLTCAEKRLPHFPPPHEHNNSSSSSAPVFTGQPSSLPSCYTTTTTAYHHLQQHHHLQQQQFHYQYQYQQQQQHYYYQRPKQQHQRRRLKHEESFDSSTTTTTNTTDTATSPTSPALRRHNFAMLKRDNSTQSESSSRYSSVDSLLEARKPDPEAILINLGFGPIGSEDILSRIPKRFLKPSQVRGIDTEAFIRRLQLANNLADHSALGYRGLTGNPDLPPSRIVAKIMQRFEVNERKKSMGSIEHTI